jgi:hypothetical protein
MTNNYGADFWGPASNFGIPIAAIADMSKDPEMYVLPQYIMPHILHHTLLYFENVQRLTCITVSPAA